MNVRQDMEDMTTSVYMYKFMLITPVMSMVIPDGVFLSASKQGKTKLKFTVWLTN